VVIQRNHQMKRRHFGFCRVVPSNVNHRPSLRSNAPAEAASATRHAKVSPRFATSGLEFLLNQATILA